MRGTFFMWLGVGLVVLALAYFVIIVIRALYQTIVDMVRQRELDRLADEYSEKRDQRQREQQQRLDSGCQHEFDDLGGALPPGVCKHCGLAREKPRGDCDHRWKKLPGIIPQSHCTLCGETFSTVHGV